MWFSMALFYSEGELGVAYAAVAAAAALAGVLGGPIAAGLLSLDGLFRLHGWQWLFLVEAVPAVALGVVVMASLARDPSSAAFLSPPERLWLRARCRACRSAACTCSRFSPSADGRCMQGRLPRRAATGGRPLLEEPAHLVRHLGVALACEPCSSSVSRRAVCMRAQVAGRRVAAGGGRAGRHCSLCAAAHSAHAPTC
jgi:hypothetical protein